MRRSQLVALLLVACLAILAIGSVLVATRPAAPAPPIPSVIPGSVIFVGSPTGLAAEAFAEVRSRVTGQAIELSEVGRLVELVELIDRSWIVIFNADWLADKVQNDELHGFFEAILATEAKITAIGDATSVLFDTLKRVDEHLFTAGRNPARDNPPLAGYRLRQAVGRDGMAYYGESILLSYAPDPVTAAEAISTWT